MSFRRRLALSCGAAVAVAVVLGSVLTYLIVRDTLREQIDCVAERGRWRERSSIRRSGVRCPTTACC